MESQDPKLDNKPKKKILFYILRTTCTGLLISASPVGLWLEEEHTVPACKTLRTHSCIPHCWINPIKASVEPLPEDRIKLLASCHQLLHGVEYGGGSSSNVLLGCIQEEL